MNYTDIGVRAGVSKDEAKNAVEQVLRSLSDKVKAGENCEIAMPGVGTFKHRGGVCAIAFSSELEQDTHGVTTKASGNRLFASSVTRENLDLLDPKKQPEQKALTITADAENWIRNNLALTIEEQKGAGMRQGDVPFPTQFGAEQARQQTPIRKRTHLKRHTFL